MKPTVSPEAKRALLFVCGLMGAVASVVVDALQGAAALNWTSLSLAAFTAAAGYALKYSGDKSADEVDRIVENRVVATLSRLFPGHGPYNLGDTLPGIGGDTGQQ